MDIEEKIREQRTQEATAKNLMGLEGKLYYIARFLGHPITAQSSDQTFLDTDDFWSENHENLPTFDEDEKFHDIGYIYNGLSEGMQIEIICKEYESSIKVFFEGYLYYEEEQGILQKYYPYPILEKHVENLFARVQHNIKNMSNNLEKQQKSQLKKFEFDEIKRLREKWGDII